MSCHRGFKTQPSATPKLCNKAPSPVCGQANPFSSPLYTFQRFGIFPLSRIRMDMATFGIASQVHKPSPAHSKSFSVQRFVSCPDTPGLCRKTLVMFGLAQRRHGQVKENKGDI